MGPKVREERGASPVLWLDQNMAGTKRWDKGAPVAKWGRSVVRESAKESSALKGGRGGARWESSIKYSCEYWGGSKAARFSKIIRRAQRNAAAKERRAYGTGRAPRVGRKK